MWIWRRHSSSIRNAAIHTAQTDYGESPPNGRRLIWSAPTPIAAALTKQLALV
jgi:hypothetical protein